MTDPDNPITQRSDSRTPRQTHIPSSRRLRMRWLGGSEDGQTVVEVALVLPVLLLVLFGVVEFGLSLNAANNETQVANEIARFATVNEDPSTKSLAEWGKTHIDSKALSGQTVCISFPNKTANIGDPVEVKISGTMSWLPILKLKTTSSTVEGKAVMRLEASPSTFKEECA
jgi:TadE-like protein